MTGMLVSSGQTTPDSYTCSLEEAAPARDEQRYAVV
jgi:hypothetical protein